MKPLRIGAALLVVSLAAVSRRAQAQTTLTFNANTCPGSSANEVLAPYLESGFKLTFTSGYAYWCTGSSNYAGGGDIFNFAPDETTTLTKVGGGTFSLASIDLATVYGGGDAGSVLVTGDLFGGGTVTATESWSASSGAPTFITDVFSGAWTNLVDVHFSQPVPYFQFDNVRLDASVSVTPEPATMTLLATGLVGIAGAGVRRRRK